MEEKIIRFFEKKREVAAVYIFGSLASGRQRSGSDVDIGVLLHPEFIEAAEVLREQCMVQLGRILRKDIHLVILNHAGEVLLKQILAKGKAILIKNQKVDNYFKMTDAGSGQDNNLYLIDLNPKTGIFAGYFALFILKTIDIKALYFSNAISALV